MKIIFIYPSMGEQENYKFKQKASGLKTWCLEPLPIATLNGITPKKWKRQMYDDRIEDIDFDEDCDLVAISVETYTAKRAYEISQTFRKKGKKVILGGFHPSLLPYEAIKYADSVLIGEAENIWNKILNDVESNSLKRIYISKTTNTIEKIKVDRSIYGNKKYFPFRLIESGRGCRFSCDFCSVSLFFNHKFRRRPIENIIAEIKITKSKRFVFVDDNICADIPSAKELFKAIMPLKIKWASQCSANIVHDDELLDLMKKSGCIGLLIGFESTNKKNIKLMNKNQNLSLDYDVLISKLHKRNIRIYASFILGYDFDDERAAKKTVEYAIKKKFFIANFYQLTPFPKTKLYDKLKKENRLIYDKWWLDDKYSYGDLVYEPKLIKRSKLAKICFDSRKQFYSYNSIIKRSFSRINLGNAIGFLLFLVVNIATRKEAFKRQERKLGRGSFIPK
jgi:radical SAM superfamily enzyme YgiQ (UPF0313 family)